MARIGINTGSAANDNTGSTLRAAGGIINDNFLEIYTRFGDGTNLTSIGGTWTSTSVGIHTLKKCWYRHHKPHQCSYSHW